MNAFSAYGEPGYPRREGFKMTFANGYTVSVAFGDGNYGNGETSAEVGAWDANGNWVELVEGNTVVGWKSPDQVLELMNKVAAL